jgi:hypothetical protein
MSMAPAEIVASLKELCESEGPLLTTGRIVAWIEQQGGFEPQPELVWFAKKMKARQYARMLMWEDEESGLRVKRLWSFRDQHTGERHYHDIAQLPADRRRRLIYEYARFVKQLRSVRRAMSDYFAGQAFFPFYASEDETEASEAIES